MSIAKETLQKQLNEIRDKMLEREQIAYNIASEKAENAFTALGFNFKKVTVSTDRISVSIPEMSHWSAVEIERRRTYKENGPKYEEPTLRFSHNGDVKNVDDVTYVFSVARLSQHFLNKDQTWNELVSLMNQVEAFYLSDETKALRKQEQELSVAVNTIEHQETQDKFKTVFSGGKLKLNKVISFTYGSGRFDYVSSDEWEWTQNGSGKTYTLYYTEKYRTNPYYDEQGNSLEAVYETRKREVPKRVRKADLEDFIKCNMNQVEG